ncbi:hypothetical protein QBC46DRAFT_449406 [Diplogelasinospora grovesii]|uniref:CFEM domain-containing protein n=1 Tax=Diplogelasinospora grovesii TaxID=303347 RepID=A0AAN6NA82_9PEZI|nr:hypothetical protein QBC46DRAFT_449406 [Diplogelasinospora grovesii]
MKTAFVVVAAAAGAMAQNLAGEPPCATPCLVSAISAAGCGPSDLACQCGPTQAAIASRAVPCLLSNCPGSLLGQIQTAGEALCVSYSATAIMTGNSTSATATATASATAAGSSNSSTAAAATITSLSPSTGTAASGSVVTSSNMTITTGSPTAAKTTSTTASSSTNVAAAAPIAVGAGAMLAFLGAVAAL